MNRKSNATQAARWCSKVTPQLKDGGAHVYDR